MQSKSQRKSREFALQFLYALHMSGKDGLDCYELKQILLTELNLSQLLLEYGENLVLSIQKNQAILDEVIQRYSEKWDLQSISIIERFILLIASAELYYYKSIPIKVVITEAVQLSKKYSAKNSFQFVNGILNAISQDLPC